VSHADHPLADLYPRPEPGTRRAVGDYYESPASRSRKARWFIGLVIAANAASVVLLGAQRALLDRGVGNIPLSEWQRSEDRVALAAFVELAVFVVAIVLFLRWLHLCYRNLLELDTKGLRFTPGWAVGWWFVPILNVVRPKQVIDDLWRATDVRADDLSGPLKGLPSTGLVGWFWGLSLAAGFVAWTAVRLSSATVSDLETRNAGMIGGHLLQIAAGACLFKLVGLLTARQDARAAARAAAAPPISVG